MTRITASDPDDERRRPGHHARTLSRRWRLVPEERRALVIMAEAYQRNEPFPRPRSYREVAEYLNRIRPDAEWNHKKVENLIVPVRVRLSRQGVAVLTHGEIAGQVGDALNINLILQLVRSGSLVPSDLDLIDDAD